jgi:2,3-bisphosphoglycerate-independent phosphoglycerate mutase
MLRSGPRRPGCAARLHVLLDGRDVPPTSALTYVDQIEAVLAELSTERLRLRHRLRRRPPCSSPWTATAPTGRWWAAAGRFTVTARAPSSPPRARPSNLPRRQARGDRPGPARLRDGARRPGRGRAARPRQRDPLQLPRRPRDRDLPAFEDEDLRQVRPRPARMCCFAGMMEYDGDPTSPSATWWSRPPSDRTMGEYLANTRPEPARGQRDPEVRARDLLLQRQPQRQVQPKSWRTTSRSSPTACPSSSGRG